jgi:formate dehydrogenase assembly factor FdhD
MSAIGMGKTMDGEGMDTKQANEAAVDRAKEAIRGALLTLQKESGLMAAGVAFHNCCMYDDDGKVKAFEIWGVKIEVAT